MLRLTLYLHILAALFWVGGMLFLVFIISPFLLTLKPEERSHVYQFVGQRYRRLGWVAIIILIATGVMNLYFMGILSHQLLHLSFFISSYGRTLLAKLLLVTVIVVSSLIHDFYLGPRARTDRKFSRLARLVGRSNMVIALLIVFCAVLLRLGGI